MSKRLLFLSFFFFIGFLLGLLFSGYFGTLSDPSLEFVTFLEDYGLDEPLRMVRDSFRFILNLDNYIGSFFADVNTLSLDISFKNLKELQNQRLTSLAGDTFIEDRHTVSADLRYHNVNYPVKVRLKGDTADHWGDEKEWSLRVELKDGKSLFGMNEFSLQKPFTRYYMNEWYFHQFLSFQDLISSRYHFVRFYFNGENWGIYALEEHLDKNLIEYNHKREGPILKFDDSHCFYQARYYADCDELYYDLYSSSSYFASPVSVYSEKKYSEDSVQRKYLDHGRLLLDGFHRGLLNPSEAFDISLFARAFAIEDFFGSRHSLQFTNIRFYYNPLTEKLEPILRDSQFIEPLTSFHGILGSYRQIGVYNSTSLGTFQQMFFTDKEFYAAYIHALIAISDETLLDDFKEFIGGRDLDELHILHKEFPWYNIDVYSTFQSNQAFIRQQLVYPLALVAYDSHGTLVVGNRHNLPLEIVAVITDGKRIALPEPFFLQARGRDSVTTLVPLDSFLYQEGDSLQIVSTVLGSPFEIITPVIPFDYSSLSIDKNILPSASPLSSFAFLSEEGTTLSFREGDWVLDKQLIIPSGYIVTASSPFTLDLVFNASIISYSPFVFVGSPEQPIHIFSSDGSGQGFVFLDTLSESSFQHVSFNNLSFLSTPSSELTGSLTFYQSPVILRDVSISGSSAEDALNIVRSQFLITSLSVQNSFSDCLDVDFSNGTISSSEFLYCGNDGLDFSGSYADVSSVSILAGDKGVSVGEDSIVHVTDSFVKEADLGFVSKDMSHLYLTSSKVSNVTYSLAVYQKKSEYGPAFIDVVASSLPPSYLIEKGSQVTIDSHVFQGDASSVYDLLYNGDE